MTLFLLVSLSLWKAFLQTIKPRESSFAALAACSDGEWHFTTVCAFAMHAKRTWSFRQRRKWYCSHRNWTAPFVNIGIIGWSFQSCIDRVANRTNQYWLVVSRWFILTKQEFSETLHNFFANFVFASVMSFSEHDNATVDSIFLRFSDLHVLRFALASRPPLV